MPTVFNPTVEQRTKEIKLWIQLIRNHHAIYSIYYGIVNNYDGNHYLIMLDTRKNPIAEFIEFVHKDYVIFLRQLQNNFYDKEWLKYAVAKKTMFHMEYSHETFDKIINDLDYFCGKMSILI